MAQKVTHRRAGCDHADRVVSAALTGRGRGCSMASHNSQHGMGTTGGDRPCDGDRLDVAARARRQRKGTW